MGASSRPTAILLVCKCVFLFRFLLKLLIVIAAAALVAAFWLQASAPSPSEATGWAQVAPMPTARGELATTVTRGNDGQRLWVIGGLAGLARTVDAVEVYDPEPDQWSEGPPLPEARHHLASAAVGASVYVSGGASDVLTWEGERSLWRLSPGETSWQHLPDMPEARWGHRMVAVDDRLYVVGGHGETARVLIYDPEDGWSTGAPMERQRDHLMVVAVDREVWAIGGRSGRGGQNHSRVDIYDVDEDSWRSGPPLPFPTSGASEGLVDNSLLIIGGEDPATFGGGIVHAHWRLDVAADELEWEPAPPPMLAVHGVEGAVVDGNLYVAGGAGRHGFWSVFSWTNAVQRLDEPAAAD